MQVSGDNPVVELQELFKDKFTGKRVLLWGLGREGSSSFDVLKRFSPKEVRLRDDSADALEQLLSNASEFSFQLTESKEALQSEIDWADIVLKSPGISTQALELSSTHLVKLSSQVDLVLQACGSSMIGITGTKGKSSTSTFLHSLLGKLGVEAQLAGNIGTPVFDLEDTGEHLMVTELSSYQLERIHQAPRIGVLLNLFQDHLDYHGGVESYHDAKWNLINVPGCEAFVYHADDPCIQKRLDELKGKVALPSLWGFSLKASPDHQALEKGAWLELDRLCLRFEDREMSLPRSHFPEQTPWIQILPALLAAYLSDPNAPHWTDSCAIVKAVAEALESREDLPHRLQYVGKVGGIEWWDDSIATVPEATIMAMGAVPRVYTLILGGRDRGVDLTSLVHFLNDSHVEQVIALPTTGHELAKELQSLGWESDHLHRVESMADAVSVAVEVTPEGRSCLLSPAAASCGEFLNFEQRGRAFQQEIEKYS